MGKRGALRTGWLILASLIACVAAPVAGRWALSRGFAALFKLWGVNAGNIRRAPAWARIVYAWHGSLATLILSAALLALALGLRRLWRLERGGRSFSPGRLARWSFTGLLGAAAVAALSLLPDSSRLAWPLTSPRLTLGLPLLCAISLLATLAEEALTKRALYDGVRGRWGRAWATLVACAVFLLSSGGWPMTAISALNVLSLGALCCLAYDRCGLWAAAGLRWGWGVGCAFLLGNNGGDAAVYRLYGVSEVAMTGGDAGAMYGLWATLLLWAGIACLVLPRRGQGRNTRSAPEMIRTSKGRSS